MIFYSHFIDGKPQLKVKKSGEMCGTNEWQSWTGLTLHPAASTALAFPRLEIKTCRAAAAAAMVNELNSTIVPSLSQNPRNKTQLQC